MLIVGVELNNELLHIISVYAPNTVTERIVFYENLSKFCVKHCDNLNNIIVAGDLNLCSKVDQSVDTFQKFLSNCKLLDVWHRKHSDEPGYTYYDKKNQSYSRLDYVLISENML